VEVLQNVHGRWCCHCGSILARLENDDQEETAAKEASENGMDLVESMVRAFLDAIVAILLRVQRSIPALLEVTETKNCLATKRTKTVSSLAVTTTPRSLICF
jgi:hypothetical protein